MKLHMQYDSNKSIPIFEALASEAIYITKNLESIPINQTIRNLSLQKKIKNRPLGVNKVLRSVLGKKTATWHKEQN